jgi:Protein of unknown function (DUF3604)
MSWLRVWLWLLLVVAVPVPFFVGEGRNATIGVVAALAARMAAAWLLDGGPITRLLAMLAVVQAVGYLVLAWLVVWALEAGLRRLAPRAVPALTRLAGVAAVVVAIAVTAVASRPLDWATTRVPGAVLAEGATRTVAAATDVREPCANRIEQRQPFFGDLHVHTTLSFDAASQDTRTRPADAYRFARGHALGLQPYDASGKPLRTVRLARPLHFTAVTDHAEFLGELDVCRTPSATGSDSPVCGIFRRWPAVSFMLLGGDYLSSPAPVRYGFCGAEGEVCRDAARGPWRETQEAAEAAYDRSAACRFTSFVGYEWTLSPDGRNLHRNVLFRGAVVPDLPISSVDAHTPEALWQRLRAECNEAGTGCEALTIPHNSNLSAGLMFLETDDRGQPLGADYARERAYFEPLAEVMQHKGASECLRGPGTTDEQCDFEQLPYDNFAGKTRPEMRRLPGPTNFLRYALKQGLIIEQKLGVNPFKYGLVGSTDTHISASGLVEERKHAGHGGAGMASGTARERATLADDVELNPGGLTALWAEENSRESLWAAMRRREAYATSGPRIVVRLFGGWAYPPDLCDGDGFAAGGYAAGVPMGGDLSARPDGVKAPTFAVSALRDPGVSGSPGALLQRIQIVKGWVEGGQAREAVFDVAGTAANGAGVDLATCTPHGTGSADLCTVWTDPAFDPAQPAFYYARVLENPTCRWQVWQCNALGVDCQRPVPPGLAACCDDSVPRTVQERAWTSPIWYRPAG